MGTVTPYVYLYMISKYDYVNIVYDTCRSFTIFI